MAIPSFSDNWSTATSTAASGTIGGVFATNSSGSGSGNGQSGDSNGFNTSAGFYKNLFYILIGLLALFGFVSAMSYVRAKRKNTMIRREAERLGVVVPGMPGYYDGRDAVLRMVHQARERQQGGQGAPARAGGEGGRKPEVWDAVAEADVREKAVSSLAPAFAEKEFVPLAVAPLFLPPPSQDAEANPTIYHPPPSSSLEFFPNAVAIPVELVRRAMAIERQEAAIRDAGVEAGEVLGRWSEALEPRSTPTETDATPAYEPPPGPPPATASDTLTRERVLDAIAREPAVHVTVLVRMPVEPRGERSAKDADEDAAVQEAYEGVCIGTTRLEIVK